MLEDALQSIVDAQLARFRGDPDALDPAALRAEAVDLGLLHASPSDLRYRDQYPALDVGVYCASHSMGKPSGRWLSRMHSHLAKLPRLGSRAWLEGGWMQIPDKFRERVAILVGGDLSTGDVAAFANYSDAASAVLFALEPGRLVSTGAHFTSGAYLHRYWADRLGGQHHEVAVEADGSVAIGKLVDALTTDTEIVSLSTAFWRLGWLHDIYAVAEAVMDICPDAAFLVDGYQTLGTVPLSTGRLPPRTAVMGGGIKQLRAGPGIGFAWISQPLLDTLRPMRTGWFAHRDPLAFSARFVEGEGAARLATGTPPVSAMHSLVSELDTFARSCGGDLSAAIQRARERTSSQVGLAVGRAMALGLDVVGRDWPLERRAAFFAIRLDNGQHIAEALAAEGVDLDFRPDEDDSGRGVLRLSANAASFTYELFHTVERIAALG